MTLGICEIQKRNWAHQNHAKLFGFLQTFEDSLIPFPIPSTDYSTQLEEIFNIGRKNSTSRTQEQTNIAYFWDIPLSK